MRIGSAVAGAVVGGVLGFALHAWMVGGEGAEAGPGRSRPSAVDDGMAASLPAPNASPSVPPYPVEPMTTPASAPQGAEVEAAYDDRVGILVFGAVTDSEGQPVPMPSESWRTLRFDDAGARRLEFRLEAGATYSASGLTPGRWRVTLDLDDFRPFSGAVVLDASRPVQRFDLVLEPAVVLDVKGYTPSGERLLDAMSEELANGERWHDVRLTAIATREPPPAALPEISHRAYSRWEVGTYRDVLERMPFQENDLPADVMGQLELDVSLPVHVSLLFRHLLLQTQVVEPGATEVVFVVPVGTLAALLGTVRVRVVSAEDGQPIDGAMAALSDTQSSGVHVDAGPDGVFEWTRQRPGRLDLMIRAPEHETLHGEVSVPPGGVLDLGTLALTPATVVRGLVLDPDDEPVAAALLRMVPEEPLGGAGQGARTSFRSDAAGRFELKGFGRRVYLVTASHDAWMSAPVRVDLRNGDVDNVVVRMVPGTQVWLRTEWAADVSYGIVVTSEDGREFSRSASWNPTWSWSKRMLPGRYEVALLDGDRVLRRLPLIVEGADVVLDVTP